MPPEKKAREKRLSGREKQLMDLIYRNGKSDVATLAEQLPDPPTQGAIRALLNILVRKGYLKSAYDGPRKVYTPTQDPRKMRKQIMKHVLRTYFQGSTRMAMASLMDSSPDLSEEDLEELIQQIKKAKKEGR